jgi:hypothetical protein
MGILKREWNKLLRESKRKGQAGNWLSFVMALGIGVVAIVVLAIMLGALQTSQTASSLPYNITGQGLTFLDNTSKQLPTAGTILGVSLLLLIIGGVAFGGYMAYKKTR